MFKIAYCAGHYLGTAGKRVPKALDKDQTREWTLNDRVARYFAQAAAQYEDVELLRTDDITGQIDVSLGERCRKANAFGADFCLSIHHNAGANLTKAGGIEAYSYPGSKIGAAYRDAIYEHCIAADGLRGNRATPKNTAGFYVLRYTVAPCVLMEYGYMDSKSDAPVILQEAYAEKMAYATMAAIAQVAGLVRKQTAEYSMETFRKELQTALDATEETLFSKTVTLSVEKNYVHPAVRPVQKRLYALGYTQVGEADGIAGPKFRSAVIAFQSDNDCWRDGIITAGNKTWRKLLGME